MLSAMANQAYNPGLTGMTVQYLIDKHIDFYIMFILAIVAIGLAYWERRQHFHTKRQIDKSVLQLDNIVNSLSTRYIGPFPEYIENINDLMSRAQSGDTLLIAYITPVIAIFTKPAYWHQVKSSIERALIDDHNIKVRAVFSSISISDRFFKDQFKLDI